MQYKIKKKQATAKSHKSIYFNDYRLNGTGSYETSKDVIDLVFPAEKKYPFIFQETSYVFEVISKENNCLFGKLAKESDDIKLSMVRIKEKNSTDEIDIDRYYFEYFTFFYFDFKQEIIAYINNRNINRFINCFQEFLRIKTDFIPLSLGSLCIQDIKSRLKDFKKIVRATGLMSSSKATHASASILKATGWDAIYKSIKIDVKFDGNTKKVAENLVDNSYKFTSLNVDVEDENGTLECINIIEHLFSHKSSIEITKIYDKDVKIIKEALKKSLSTPLLAKNN